MGVRETDIMEENKEGKEKKEKLEKGNDKEEINKKENVFVRVKERLSMRSKKKKKVVNSIKENEESLEEKKVTEKEAEKQHEMDNKPISDSTDGDKQDNCETENIFQRLLNRVSFRSKKKREKSVVKIDTEVDIAEEDCEMDPDSKNETKSLSESSLAEDTEIQALCGEGKEERKLAPSIPTSSRRPPLPTMRRPPSSATTAQSRPVSQLDVALKQFKLSTAASRENLRSSRVDISQVEEQVKAMVTSRPSTPTPAGWRSRAPPENTNLADQWTKLSASLTDLR
jgi:hypothetical protein